MSDSVIVARPTGPAQQLMLLFHGVGASAQDLVPLGRVLAEEFPEAFIVSVAAPLPAESRRRTPVVLGAGHQRGQPPRPRRSGAARVRRDRGASGSARPASAPTPWR